MTSLPCVCIITGRRPEPEIEIAKGVNRRRSGGAPKLILRHTYLLSAAMLSLTRSSPKNGPLYALYAAVIINYARVTRTRCDWRHTWIISYPIAVITPTR